MADFFAPTLEWLDAAAAKGAHVLLHCSSGTYRSSAVATAWRMHKCADDAAAALSAVRERRPMANPAKIPALWSLLQALGRAQKEKRQ